MTKQIKGSLDEIVEEIVKHLDESNLVVCRTENLLDENNDFIPMSDPVAGSYIRTALEKFVFDWTRTCECHEMDRHGETFCCNHCGRPVTNQSYSDKTPIVICGEPLRTTQKKGGDDEG